VQWTNSDSLPFHFSQTTSNINLTTYDLFTTAACIALPMKNLLYVMYRLNFKGIYPLCATHDVHAKTPRNDTHMQVLIIMSPTSLSLSNYVLRDSHLLPSHIAHKSLHTRHPAPDVASPVVCWVHYQALAASIPPNLLY
jgi:hypothetical protein